MRPLALLLSLAVLAACDSGPSNADLDLGEFRGADAAIEGAVNGWAFHDLSGAEAGGLATVPIRLELRAGDTASRVVGVNVPLDGRLVPGIYPLSADASAEASSWISSTFGGTDELFLSVDGTVTIDEVRRTSEYAKVIGSVEIVFSTGTLTGTFRAVDSAQPSPVSGCNPARTVCNYY